jgi:hypothetical protein
MAWAGWGAGPSGAGSVGGPSRIFLALAFVAALVSAGIGVAQERWGVAGAGAVAGVYFAARLFLGLGRGK